MAANVETMFYTREKPWHGLGTMVAEAPNSKDALRLAGLNWKVLKKPLLLQIHYWARVSVMRQPVPCRKDAVCGCLPDCQGSLSLAVSGSVRIWYFPIPMTVREP